MNQINQSIKFIQFQITIRYISINLQKMSVHGSLLKTPIQQKAIQKFPFTLNNQTYFSSQSFYQNTIINGIVLELKEATGISNEEQAVSYLNYSNRLIFYAGANILSYNLYKRKYQIIQQSKNLVCLKALSLSTVEKQYIVWLQKNPKNIQLSRQSQAQKGKQNSTYQLCVKDLSRKQKIHDEKLTGINEDTKAQNIEILTFMHPSKVLGVAIWDPENNKTRIIFKKITRVNDDSEYAQQGQIQVDERLKNLKYDLESNSYFFIKDDHEIWAIRCVVGSDKDHQNQYVMDNRNEEVSIEVEKLLSIKNKKLAARKIIHFALSQAYLIILTCKQNNQRDMEFYSLFSYSMIFTQTVWTPQQILMKKSSKNCFSLTNQKTDNYIVQDGQSKCLNPIDYIEFNKSVIIGLRGNSTQISIYSLYEQNLRHIRDTLLDLDNCYKIQKLFINPFSSQVMILSRHYQLEGALTTSQKSTKLIRRSQTRYKNFYLQISSFFITMQASVINVQKMSLQKKNYNFILTAPWLSQFFIQAQNSVKGKRWEQKFDGSIRCSAIHPTGQYVALGFNDCFKIYFLTYEGLIHTFVTENVKQCTSLSYSKNGSNFAVATNFSIYIYNCYTYQKINQISLGMSYRIEQINYTEGYQNLKVKQCLQCITTNKRLVIYNADQNYRQQFAFNPKSHLENGLLQGIMNMVQARKNKLLQSAIIQSNEDTTYIEERYRNNDSSMGQNRKFGIVLYDDKTKVVIFTYSTKIYFVNSDNFQSLGCFEFQQVSCAQLCRNLNTIFFGTASGKIIAFPWPNKPINITSKIPCYQAHKSRIKKLKISSNMFQLISITEQSMYIHSLTFVQQMRKIQKYELQRQFSSQSMLCLDFYIKFGICLFTTDKFQQKCQIIKQNEEEAVNFNFILPEEREKQKVYMLSRLEGQKQKICNQTYEQNLPLKLESINLKQKIRYLQKQIKTNQNMFGNLVQKQVQSYQKRISQLSNEKDELRDRHGSIIKQLQKQMASAKQQLKKQSIRNSTLHNMKLEQANRKTNTAQQQRNQAVNNFYQLGQMDEQKKILNSDIVKSIQAQISVLVQRNGYLMCRNANLQKQISTRKRKIEDIKEMIQNTKENIQNLPKNSKKMQRPADLKEQAMINKQFAQAQKKYLEETKKLIQKNKAVNVCIELYEKERQMLVILEKRLQKQEMSIDQIVKYISKQRDQKGKIKQKANIIGQRAKRMIKKYQTTNNLRIKMRNELKQYVYNLTLFNQGVIDMEKVKKISQIQPQDMVNPPENIQINIQEKKKRIGKIESAQEKILNVMKNQRKIYSNQKRKTCLHSQDLLVNFNFLLHENKHLQNLIKDQKQKKKYCIKNINSRRDNKRQLTKPTPFENYSNSKIFRRTKTSPCQEFDLSR